MLQKVLFNLIIVLALYRWPAARETNKWLTVGKIANIGEPCFHLDIHLFQFLSFLPSSTPKPALMASWFIISGLCNKIIQFLGFPGSSAGKESAYNSGDPRSIPGSGRSAGEGIGCPLQYSWASFVAQLVKNLPAMWETWVLIPGLERSPEEGKGYPLQYSGLENSMDCIDHGVLKSQTELSHFHNTYSWKSLRMT